MPDKTQVGLEATYRLYETAEGWVFLAAQFDREFKGLCRALGREDLLEDERYATWAARNLHKTELGLDLEALFRTRTAEEWERDLWRRRYRLRTRRQNLACALPLRGSSAAGDRVYDTHAEP